MANSGKVKDAIFRSAFHSTGRLVIGKKYMEKTPSITLPWHGQETIESIPQLLEHSQQIEVVLPDSYNHALFTVLHPDAPPAQLEDMDSSGGPELLGAIAKVKGLEGFGQLVDDAAIADVTVQVTTPARILITRDGKKAEQQ